jgi:putative protease
VEFLREQLGRLGHTPYELGTITAKISGQPMVPLSVIGQLRRAWIKELDRIAIAPPPRSVALESVLPQLRPDVPPPSGESKWTLTVLCRSLNQLQQVLAAGIDEVLVDFEDIRQYASAVALSRQQHATIWLATPRICKPGETGVFRALARHRATGILARNLAAIDFFQTAGVPVLADYSLNVANEISARYLHEMGVRRMTASYDLNRDQILALVQAVPRSWLEVVIHQHMPMFHMEHCVFCAVLSPGTDKTNCGRPCDRHEVRLRDRVGMEHPLTADVGCRNTLFNARPQSAAEVVPQLRACGVQWFRIELLVDQPAEQTRRTIELYRQLLAGQRSGKEVWSQLQAANRLGVTRGTLEERRNPLAIL